MKHLIGWGNGLDKQSIGTIKKRIYKPMLRKYMKPKSLTPDQTTMRFRELFDLRVERKLTPEQEIEFSALTKEMFKKMTDAWQGYQKERVEYFNQKKAENKERKLQEQKELEQEALFEE